MTEGSHGPTVLIVGDSHTHALKVARRNRTTSDFASRFAIYSIAREKNGGVIGDKSFDEILAIAKSLDEKDWVFSTIGGNQHNAIGLIQHPIAFDIIENHEEYQFRSDLYFIPTNAMRSYIDRGLRGRDGEQLIALKSATKARLLHIFSPPPKDDEAHILRRHESQYARAGLANKGISPAPLRLKLWRMQRQISSDFCAELDVGFLMAPPGTTNESGFLKPDFFAEDASHANGLYGAAVLRQVEAVIKGTEVE